MTHKKAFTLAEILIVLMVIGVIATMTIPSLMKGVIEAQLKAGYKKAYNTIVNFAAAEKISGTLPIRASNAGLNSMYSALNSSLSVKAYAFLEANQGWVLKNYKSCLTLMNNAGTLGKNTGDCAAVSQIIIPQNGGPFEGTLPWIITDDNMAYSVVRGRAMNENALTKQQLNAVADDKEAGNKSSFVVIVDVNGLTKGPNVFEKQGYTTPLEEGKSLDTITGDVFKIYIGSDGATAGPRGTTVTGRIVADAK
ncbi:MAG: prepilin-type N-terminal cleavage/methylation domain-containing protein [Candidatus Gastranaerophilales bacterium]|nr:prepilin-type N-terminal cleavage/methylation domain-containing protein [Candidatus Gastranaerophilales bacterium]